MFQSIQAKRNDHGTQSIEISMAPLIDMVFILLIFFIVTTVFVEETGVEVEKPEAASAMQLDKNSVLIAVTTKGLIAQNSVWEMITLQPRCQKKDTYILVTRRTLMHPALHKVRLPGFRLQRMSGIFSKNFGYPKEHSILKKESILKLSPQKTEK